MSAVYRVNGKVVRDRRPDYWIFILIGLGALLLGASFLFGSINDLIKRSEHNKTYGSTKGTVVEEISRIQHRKKRGARTVYAGVYEYEVNGKTYYFTDEVYSTVHASVGSTKTIRYNPRNPSEAYIEGKMTHGEFFILPGSFLVLFGVMDIVFNIRAYFSTRKNGYFPPEDNKKIIPMMPEIKKKALEIIDSFDGTYYYIKNDEIILYEEDGKWFLREGDKETSITTLDDGTFTLEMWLYNYIRERMYLLKE